MRLAPTAMLTAAALALAACGTTPGERAVSGGLIGAGAGGAGSAATGGDPVGGALLGGAAGAAIGYLTGDRHDDRGYRGRGYRGRGHKGRGRGY